VPNHCLLKENKFARRFCVRACSANIVKRRLIWRLPGVGDLSPMSEPFPDEPCDGLAGRILGRDGR